ncbi:tyrosine-type recombinase/integrase [Gimesia chilikensis]|uniref:tyrosine-type recombinase/integrase n=1 Tax=Gimesia chilikensis TaxID=2605989 RepID=UPI003A904166
MASITKQPNGRKMIQFYDTDNIRKTIRLGKVSMAMATGFRVKVENLFASKVTGLPVDRETAMWVTDLDPKMKMKLAKVGLIKAGMASTLGPFLDGYVAMRSDVKDATATVYGHTVRNLKEYFGVEKRLIDITKGDADKWRIYLREEGLADNTIRRRSGIAKQFFIHAEKEQLIASNPFEDLAAAVQVNREREFFVTRDIAKKVIDKAPDAEWRMIIALSRYGGLRCPSEILRLRWEDIDRETDRVLVTSPKTEHHAGKDSRVIPLFPELVPYLDECYELSDSEYVISRYRSSEKNFRTRLERIQKRAKVPQWPKPFHNMRASRETELCNDFPEHVVCAWLGNSVRVARKSYLQVTDDHFEKALRKAQRQPVKMSENE